MLLASSNGCLLLLTQRLEPHLGIDGMMWTDADHWMYTVNCWLSGCARQLDVALTLDSEGSPLVPITCSHLLNPCPPGQVDVPGWRALGAWGSHRSKVFFRAVTYLGTYRLG